MPLPPLANLIAICEPDPAAAGLVAERMMAGGEFEEIWRPHERWVVGTKRFPDSEPEGSEARQAGLVFAEGRDLFEAARHSFAELAECSREAPKELSRFPGDFGFLRIDRDGAAFAARSCAGLAPFYFWTGEGRAAIATSLAWLVRWAVPDPRPDALVGALWATGWAWFPDDRSPLRGVSVLPRGSFVSFLPDGVFERGTWWDPRPAHFPEFREDDAAERAGEFRRLLVERLEKDLHPGGGNLLALSGGVDSGSLAALAAGTVKRPVWTASMLPEPEEAYRKEMSFIGPLEESFGFERNWRFRVTPELQLAMIRTAPRAPFPIVNPTLCLLPRILAEAPVRVLFGGEFADRLVGCVSTIPDFMAACGLRGILRHFGFSPLGRRLLLSWAKRKAVGRVPNDVPFPDDLPEVFDPALRDEAREFHDRVRRRSAGDAGPWKQLTLFLKQDGWLSMNWEAVSAMNVRRSFPYFHRAAVELAYACHPAELVGPGTKKILRRALAGDVPGRNLNRSDKGTWGRYLLARDAGPTPWGGDAPNVLQGILRPDWLADFPKEIDFADIKRLNRLVVFGENIENIARSRKL